jgi:hypothetical protein
MTSNRGFAAMRDRAHFPAAKTIPLRQAKFVADRRPEKPRFT